MKEKLEKQDAKEFICFYYDVSHFMKLSRLWFGKKIRGNFEKVENEKR